VQQVEEGGVGQVIASEGTALAALQQAELGRSLEQRGGDPADRVLAPGVLGGRAAGG